MQITAKPQEDSKVLVEVTIPAADVDARLSKVYKDLAKRHDFPGFRQGKAPRPVIDNALGRETVLALATEELINDAYPKTVEAERLFPAGQPVFADTDSMIEPGADFAFAYTLPVKAEVEIDSYDPVEIELPQEGASDIEIDEQMKQLLKHYDQEEPTEEWAKETMGFESLDDMRSQIAEQISEQKKMLMPRLRESAASIELIKRVSAEVPEAAAELKESQLLQDFFTQLQRQGGSFDAYLMQQGIDADEFKQDVKRQAEDEVKREMALDAWARKKGLEATDAEVSEEFRKAAGDGAEKLEQEWRDEGRLYLIREELMRSKAMKDIIDGAVVTEVDFAARAREEEAEEEKASKKKAAKKDDKADKDEKAAEDAEA